MERARFLRFGWILALAGVTAAPAARGQSGSGTTVQVTPYIWMPGIGSDFRLGPGGPTFRVDRSVGDVLETSDAAFFITGLVKTDRLVLVGDLTHSSSSPEGLVPTGNPVLPAVSAEGSLRQTSATALAGYRAVELQHVSLDVLGGARAWWIRAGITVPALAVSASAKTSFVDPIFATRINVKPSSGFSLLLYGDIGGFGAASEVTGQAVVTANLRVARKIWLSGGYRYLHVDHKSGGIRVGATLAGPLLGATFAF